MPIQTRYLFSAAMDVEPDKEALFNEVYDAEHVPMLMAVPGVISVARFKTQEEEIKRAKSVQSAPEWEAGAQGA